MSEVKEWVTVAQSARGDVTVRCTLVDGNHAVRWVVKAYTSSIADDVVRARAGAQRALEQIREVA